MASFDNSERAPPGKKFKNTSDDEREEKFPHTLEEFGYAFIDGKMQNIKTGAPFEFVIRENDNEYNQKRYEAIGEVVTEYVYNLLLTEGKLKKKLIPVDADGKEPHTFIFHSEDAFTNSKLIILIHGSGVVRAGQWSRRLIMNDCLDSGTQLPFLKKAESLGYGIFVLNTNDQYRVVNGVKQYIRSSRDSTRHTQYVWENVISKTAAKHVAIIAHSYGGAVAVNLCDAFYETIKDKVFAIAFTDSTHSLENQNVSSAACVYLRKIGRNWVCSKSALDSVVRRCTSEEIECASAGTNEHEMTSWLSLNPIFKFIEDRLKRRMQIHADL